MLKHLNNIHKESFTSEFLLKYQQLKDQEENDKQQRYKDLPAKGSWSCSLHEHGNRGLPHICS